MAHEVYYDDVTKEVDYKDILNDFLDGNEVVAGKALLLQEKKIRLIEQGIYAFNLFDGSIHYLGHRVTDYDKILLGNDLFIKYSRGVFVSCHIEVIEELREFKERDIQKKLVQEYKRGTRKIRVYDLVLTLIAAIIFLYIINSGI